MTLNTAMSRGWTAAVAAAILATVAALAFLGIARAQSVSDVTVGSATVAPGDDVTIEITSTADGLGSYRVDVVYDATLVTATECKSTYGQCSIDVVGTNTVRINGVDTTLEGWTGDLVLGSITFSAGNTEGTAALTVDTATLVTSDVDGGDLSVTPTDGAITIAAPATDAPTATPGDLPDTGGSAGTSSTSSLAWLLAAAGLAVVAGGAWVLARAGREN